MPIEPPDMDREFTTHVAEHEIYMSFNGDSDAALFEEWWNLKGLSAFQKWAEAELKKRERLS